MASLLKDLGEAGNITNLRQNMTIALLQHAIPVNEPLHVLINHALLRMDNALVEGVIQNFSRARNVHHDTQYKAVRLWIERTKMVGNFFRQHRKNAVGKVYGGSAISGLGIH